MLFCHHHRRQPYVWLFSSLSFLGLMGGIFWDVALPTYQSILGKQNDPTEPLEPFGPVDDVTVIYPDVMKIDHQNELFTKTPAGSQVEYVFQGQRYPAVSKDFWIRPAKSGPDSFEVVVRDALGEQYFRETFHFEAVAALPSDATCNRFLPTEIEPLVGRGHLDQSVSVLGENGCVWSVPNQPAQTVALALHEGASATAMAAWLDTTTAVEIDVEGSERAWHMVEYGGFRVLAFGSSQFVDVGVSNEFLEEPPLAMAIDLAELALNRALSGELPPAIGCSVFTPEEVSLIAGVDVTEAVADAPVSCLYSSIALDGYLLTIAFTVHEGRELDRSALDEFSDSSLLFETTDVEIAGWPGLLVAVSNDLGHGVAAANDTTLFTAVVLVVQSGESVEGFTSSEQIARNLVSAALRRS